MNIDKIVISLTQAEAVRLEMILVDKDSAEAFSFLEELRKKIVTSRQQGMKSHLDY